MALGRDKAVAKSRDRYGHKHKTTQDQMCIYNTQIGRREKLSIAMKD